MTAISNGVNLGITNRSINLCAQSTFLLLLLCDSVRAEVWRWGPRTMSSTTGSREPTPTVASPRSLRCSTRFFIDPPRQIRDQQGSKLKQLHVNCVFVCFLRSMQQQRPLIADMHKSAAAHAHNSLAMNAAIELCVNQRATDTHLQIEW